MPQADFMDRIASGETQRTALLFAFYNSVIFTLLGLCLIGIFAIYQVLYMFLMPIIWAILVGTVMFPIKHHIGASLKGWLNHLDEDNKPLVVGVALLPLEVMRSIADCVYDTALSTAGVYCGIGYVILKILCFDDIFLRFLSWIGIFYSVLDFCIELTTQRLIIASLVLYTTGFIAWVSIQEKVHKKFARTLSLPIWIFVLTYTANFFGPLRVIIFAVTIVILLLIAIGAINIDDKADSSTVFSYKGDESNEKPIGLSSNDDESGKFVGVVAQESNKEIQKEFGNSAATIAESRVIASIGHEIEDDLERLDHALSGDAHLRIIGGLCLLLWTVHHDILLIFILISFFIAGFIRIGQHIGVFDVLMNLANAFWSKINGTVYKVINIVVAGSLRKFVRFLFSSDKMFISSLTSRVDFIASISVMASIAMGSLFFSLFIIFQLHNETVHLVKLGSNLVQSNPDWMKYAINYTEGQLAEHDIGAYIEQGYHQGRQWLASNVRSLADPADPDRADQLENQVKQMIDSVYRMWTERNSELNATTRTISSFHAKSPYEWMIQIISTSNIQTLRKEITNIISENIETVFAVIQSVWTVVLLNFSLLRTIVGAILNLVLGFGFELINLIIELIVFLTVVYYLLSSSDEQWLPLRLIGEFATPAVGVTGNANLNIADAFGDAINGVFVLSAKMSIFYGFYTYFVHSLFELNIVFLPSMLAALFAVIPIMPSYIVALIGFVEIFFVRGDSVAGAVFILASIAPLFFADAAFYRELKGTHPYLTGLAVIGGMYWLGLQGAIFGPIILCCVIALFNLYNDFAKTR